MGQRCPPGFTTKSRGAKSEAECGCYTGQYEIEVEGNRSCVPCSLSSMVCDEAAITVFELPVAPGYWRQHYWSAPGQKAPSSSNNGSVLACHTKEACLGGVNLSSDIFCSRSQQGPYCAVCRDGFFGGGDGKLCTPCRGSSFLTFLPIIIILVVVFAALTNLLRTCCCGNTGFATGITRTSERLRWLQDKWTRSKTKTKILIGLFQMLQGIGITFAIRWPNPYGEVINFLGSIFQLDLPQAMPISCFANFGFSGSLVVRTTVPLLLIVLMHVLSRWLSHFKKHQAANMCSSECFFLIFLVYPGCSSAVFQTFICDRLDDGSSYLRVDYSVQCSESDQAGNAWTPEYVQVSE